MNISYHVRVARLLTLPFAMPAEMGSVLFNAVPVTSMQGDGSIALRA